MPLFVIDPRLLTGRFASPNRTWFLARSLDALAAQLAARGSSLVIRHGNPAPTIPLPIVNHAEARRRALKLFRAFDPGRART